MGEYINASIRFGGKLPAEHADELVELINEKGLDPDWGHGGGVTREDLLTNAFFASNDVNYGNLDELCEFAAEHGLWYEHQYDAGPEWDAATVVYNPETKQTRDFKGSDREMGITLHQVKELGSYEAILAYFDVTLPLFEIVGELPLEGDHVVVDMREPDLGRSCECFNCGWNGVEDQLNEIKDFASRVEAGDSAVPAGECPVCCCLAYLKEVDEELLEKAEQKHNAQMLDGCETEDELNAELRAQTQGR